MTEKYQSGQTVGINPSAYTDTDQPAQGEFAAAVKVVSSRYAPTTYSPDSGFQNKIAIKWVVQFASGKSNEKTYSTGIPFGTGVVDISQDGKRLISRSSDFGGYKANSDAILLLRRAITAAFPENLVTDDVSVFEGHAFYIVNDTNPGWKGSSKKPYPKKYFPQGWDALMAERAANQGNQQYNNPTVQKATPTATATLVSNYQVPQVALASNVTTEASSALVEILAVTGGKVTRTEIPAKLNSIAGGKGWAPKMRQEITLALWDISQLSSVVASNPALQLSGETVSFKSQGGVEYV